MNTTLADELNKYGIMQPNLRSDSPVNELNQSAIDLNCSSNANQSVRLSFVPDVSGILSLVDDPSLLNFVKEKGDENISPNTSKMFDLNGCLEKLKYEADSLLQLSEKMMTQKHIGDNREMDETQKSLEEEDGLKVAKDDYNVENTNQKPRLNLPNYFTLDKQDHKTLSHSDLNDLKNRLVLAETKNQDLEKKLAESMAQQHELIQKLNSLVDSQSEELSEG